MPADNPPLQRQYLRGTDCVQCKFFSRSTIVWQAMPLRSSICGQNQLNNSLSWQTAFIHDNFPVLGYFAWAGFQHFGKGLLLCHLELPPMHTELKFHAWQYTTQFLPSPQVSDYLLRLAVSSLDMPPLVQAIDHYNPQQEIMLMMIAGQSVEINWLRNLAVYPPVCHIQVCNRWDEFMLYEQRSNLL